MSQEEIESGALEVKPKPNTEIMAELRAGHWTYDPGQGSIAPLRYEHDDDKGKGDFGKGNEYFGKSNDDYGKGKGHFGNGKGYGPGQGLLAPWSYEPPDDKGKGDFGKGKDYFGKSNDDYGEGKGHFGNGKGEDRDVICLCPTYSPENGSTTLLPTGYGTTGDIRTRMPSANLSDDFQIVYYGKGKGKGKDDFGKGKDEHDIEEEPPLPIPPPPPLPKAIETPSGAIFKAFEILEI